MAGLVLFLLLRLLITPAKPPPDLYQQGREFYQSGNYSLAIEKLRKEVQEHPNRQETRLLLGQSYIQLRQWAVAQSYLRERLTVLPQDAPTIYWLARALYGAGRTAEAERNWQGLIDRKEAGWRGLANLALAEMYYRQNDYGKAANALYQTLSLREVLEPADEQRAHYLYGVLLARDLRFDDALNELEKAANVKAGGVWSDNGPVQNTLSRISERSRQVSSAITTAQAEKVETARRAKLAYGLFLAEEFAPAEEQLVTVLKRVPDFTDARAYLGLVYWRTGRSDAAVAALTNALKPDPKNRLARQSLAEVYTERLQNFQPELSTANQYKTESENARRLLESLLSEKPDDVLLIMDMARLDTVLRDYEQAEAFYYYAIKLNKEKSVVGVNPGATLARFYTEAGLDPCRRGVSAGEQASQDAPKDAESWYAFGLAYALCNKPKEAAPLLEKALVLRPNWALVVHRLGLVYQELGRQSEADKLFARATDLDPMVNWPRL